MTTQDTATRIAPFVTNTLVESFDFFNDALFDNELPDANFVIANLNMHRKRNAGVIRGLCEYECIKNAAIENGKSIHKTQITLDNQITGLYVEQNDVRTLMSVLVHEMTHQWDLMNNPKKQIKGGHGLTWRKAMKTKGLTPVMIGSSWNKGSTHSIDEDGLYSKVFNDFPQELVDRYPQFANYIRFYKRKPSTYERVWHTYTCPECGEQIQRKGEDNIAACVGSNFKPHKLITFTKNGNLVPLIA